MLYLALMLIVLPRVLLVKRMTLLLTLMQQARTTLRCMASGRVTKSYEQTVLPEWLVTLVIRFLELKPSLVRKAGCLEKLPLINLHFLKTL